MFKRCLLAVIVALLVTSSQIAAAYDYDWNQAKRISTKAEFYRYVEAGRRAGQTVFHVVITNDSILPNVWKTNIIDKNDFANIVPCRDWELLNSSWINGKSLGIHFNLIEYPGTRVANAYLSRNQKQAWMNLTNEEQELYNVAIGIVDEANKLSSEREKAKYIHDEICRRVVDWKNENERNKTAIGALIDHYAQCQGYTDAFYMLGRMSGLNVGRIGGTINNGATGHAWNWITFNDGKTYCVDVTLDDGYNSHDYFLKTRSQMEKTHSCYWEIIPNLQ